MDCDSEKKVYMIDTSSDEDLKELRVTCESHSACRECKYYALKTDPTRSCHWIALSNTVFGIRDYTRFYPPQDWDDEMIEKILQYLILKELGIRK